MDTELTDAVLLMFDKLMGGLSRRAERKAVDNAAVALRDAQRHLRLLARAGRALIAAREDGTDAAEAVEDAVGWGPFLRAVAEAEQIARPETLEVRAELVQRWSAMRQFAPAFGWRPFVVDTGGKVDRRAWEVCVLSELRDRLRAGDVWVRGSRRYRNFEDYLLPKPTFVALRAGGPLPVGVKEDVERHLSARRDAFAATMEDVAVLAKAGQLPDAVLDETGLRITPLKAETPPEAQRAAQDAYGMLPRPRITDLLLEVDGWTGFSDCFTHQRSGRSVEERAALLTTVLADGINLGLSRMAESCQGHSLRQLAWMHDWHVREECYAAALARLIEAHRALPLARVWATGPPPARTDSSSAQVAAARRWATSTPGMATSPGSRSTPTSPTSSGPSTPRLSRQPPPKRRTCWTGCSSTARGCASPSITPTPGAPPKTADEPEWRGLGQRALASPVHVPEQLHGLEQAGSAGRALEGERFQQVFGLLALLGFRFAPRLRDLKDRRLYVFRGQAVPEVLAGMVGGTVDAEHVRAHWDEALRLAVSVGSGHASASGMLRRLAAYPRQNGLAVALREIGRVERSLFTLEWLRSGELRRRANAGLNKGEARNALARAAVFFHRLGELRDRSFENQAFRASGLNLLVAAIILWNTRYLQAAFDALAARGAAVPPDLMRHVAPLGWEHISLTGDYVWAADAQPGPGLLRPLRERSSLLAA
jgi:TnpA family transposase